jgi:hypothetical protein
VDGGCLHLHANTCARQTCSHKSTSPLRSHCNPPQLARHPIPGLALAYHHPKSPPWRGCRRLQLASLAQKCRSSLQLVCLCIHMYTPRRQAAASLVFSTVHVRRRAASPCARTHAHTAYARDPPRLGRARARHHLLSLVAARGVRGGLPRAAYWSWGRILASGPVLRSVPALPAQALTVKPTGLPVVGGGSPAGARPDGKGSGVAR